MGCHFGDDVACYLLYVNLPLLRGVPDTKLAALMAKHPHAGWTRGADELQRDESASDYEDAGPYFIELAGESFIRDDSDDYASVVPFMYRVCAWIEGLVKEPSHGVKVAPGFRAFINVHDAYEDIDADLRRSAAKLDVTFKAFMSEAIDSDEYASTLDASSDSSRGARRTSPRTAPRAAYTPAPRLAIR